MKRILIPATILTVLVGLVIAGLIVANRPQTLPPIKPLITTRHTVHVLPPTKRITQVYCAMLQPNLITVVKEAMIHDVKATFQLEIAAANAPAGYVGPLSTIYKEVVTQHPNVTIINNALLTVEGKSGC